ncbi:hypothetical protein [Fodinicurvata sediminis]|uniref:hypothetical protein n=1 Tax=Fodinicurvata sediminis TaxID=1121832 RepID=UPI0003B4F248|nr:hypothetical protein [Fodinicurvata sediminis]
MRAIKIVAIALIIAGVITLVLPYIPFTQEKEVLDVGPITATAEDEKRVQISPFIGFGLLVVGSVLLIFDRTKQ